MAKFFNKHFAHFVLYIFEVAFSYLHKHFDVFYDFDCNEFDILSKKDGDLGA